MKTKPTKARDRATPRPARRAYTTLRQIVEWIPEGLPDRIAREAKADIRSFSCTSHVLALLYGQITRSGSLNEICDASRLHEPELNRIRGATAPKRMHQLTSRSRACHSRQERLPGRSVRLPWWKSS